MKVCNIESTRGNLVPNQFEIRTDNAVYFQSYSSIIVKREFSGRTFLDETYWNYSKTTSKYRNIFLGETTKETQRKINEGIYVLTNLNGGEIETKKNIIDFKFFK